MTLVSHLPHTDESLSDAHIESAVITFISYWVRWSVKNDRWSYDNVQMWELMTRCMDTRCSLNHQPASFLLFLIYLQLQQLQQRLRVTGFLSLGRDVSSGQRALTGWDYNLNEAQGGKHTSLSQRHFHFNLKETQVGTRWHEMGVVLSFIYKLFLYMTLSLKGLRHVNSKHTSFKLQNKFVWFKINP